MNSRGHKVGTPEHRRCALAAVTLVAIMGATPRQSNAEGIDWTIAPYIWASGVGLDVKVNSDPIIGTDVPFSDLVDKIDSSFMGHIEMSGERFGAFLDTIVIDLADSAVIPVGPGGPVFGDLLIDSDLTLRLFELGGFYRMGSPDPGSSAFDLLLGARQVDMELNLAIVLPGPGATPIDRKIDVSETDVFFGGRIVGRFNPKWHYKIRADYGGGGTEGTFNTLAAVGYNFGKTDLFSIDLGYRYLSIKLENESNGSITEIKQTMSGPLLGFIFTF